jgi:hypothetical protein
MGSHVATAQQQRSVREQHLFVFREGRGKSDNGGRDICGTEGIATALKTTTTGRQVGKELEKGRLDEGSRGGKSRKEDSRKEDSRTARARLGGRRSRESWKRCNLR